MSKEPKSLKREFLGLTKKVQNKIISACHRGSSVEKYSGIIYSEKISDSDRAEILKRNNFSTLLYFASKGKILEVVKFLSFLTPVDRYNFFKCDHFSFVKSIAEHGRVGLADIVLSYLAGSDRLDAISNTNFQLLRIFALEGDIKNFSNSLSLLPKRAKDGFLKDQKSAILKCVAEACIKAREKFNREKAKLAPTDDEASSDFDHAPYLSVLKLILSNLDSKIILEALRAQKSSFIKLIAEIGDVEFFEEVISYFSEAEEKRVIRSNNAEIIVKFAEENETSIVKKFLSLFSKSEIYSILKSCDFKILDAFVNHGEFESLSSILQMLDIKDLKDVLTLNNSRYLRILASDRDQKDLLLAFLKLFSQEELNEIFKEYEYALIRKLANHLEVSELRELIESMGDLVPKVLQAKNFAILKKLLSRGEVTLFGELIKELDDAVKDEAMKSISKLTDGRLTPEEVIEIIESGSDLDTPVSLIGAQDEV